MKIKLLFVKDGYNYTLEVTRRELYTIYDAIVFTRDNSPENSIIKPFEKIRKTIGKIIAGH